MKKVLVLIFLALAAGGCRAAPDENSGVNALSTQIAATATAQAAIVPTDTPDAAATAAAAPTDTPVPPTDEPATAVPSATANLAATADADAAANATAQALAPIEAELQSYGLDPAAGEVDWIHPPLTIEATGYLTYTYANQRLATVARDFVLAADITWNTRFGTTGCGYVLRSNGEEDEFDQYILLATRAGSGEVLFTIMEDGRVKTNEITEIFAGSLDPQFEWQNDTTNHMAVVAEGNTFTIYTNGTNIGTVTPSVAFDRGFVAFVALNESGTTTCHFENAWLWLKE